MTANRPRPRNRSTWRPSLREKLRGFVPYVELLAVLLALWSAYESRLSSEAAEQSADAMKDALILQQASVGNKLGISFFKIRQVSETAVAVEFNVDNHSDFNFDEVFLSCLVLRDHTGTQEKWAGMRRDFGPVDITRRLPARTSQFIEAGLYDLVATDSFLVVVDFQWRLTGMTEFAHSWYRINCWKSEYGEFIPIRY